MSMPERNDMNLPERDGDFSVEEQAFTEIVLRRFDRHRRRRRMLVAGSCLFALVAAAWLLALVPVPDPRPAIGGLRDMLAVLAMAALCGVVWIAADAGDKFC
jgi:membrane protease YdiL (CAAX protease family)